VHLGEADVAERTMNAWLCTLESGIHTADVYRPQLSTREVGTKAFTDAIIERLGDRPQRLQPAHYRASGISVHSSPTKPAKKELVGVDVFLDWAEEGRDSDALGHGLESATPDAWQLKMITNRGVKVYPGGIPETFRTDHWRCRFVPAAGGATSFNRVLDLLRSVSEAGYDVIKTEHLYTFDGDIAYSLGQGE
jgi:isocitrate dehydrogenase